MFFTLWSFVCRKKTASHVRNFLQQSSSFQFFVVRITNGVLQQLELQLSAILGLCLITLCPRKMVCRRANQVRQRDQQGNRASAESNRLSQCGLAILTVFILSSLLYRFELLGTGFVFREPGQSASSHHEKGDRSVPFVMREIQPGRDSAVDSRRSRFRLRLVVLLVRLNFQDRFAVGIHIHSQASSVHQPTK